MAKIRFIRKYEFYRKTYYDIIYASGRIFTVDTDRMPKTAKAFIETHSGKEQYDITSKRYEIIYN